MILTILIIILIVFSYYYSYSCECMFSPAYAPVAFLMLNRPLAIGSAGGGLSISPSVLFGK